MFNSTTVSSFTRASEPGNIHSMNIAFRSYFRSRVVGSTSLLFAHQSGLEYNLPSPTESTRVDCGGRKEANATRNHARRPVICQQVCILVCCLRGCQQTCLLAKSCEHILCRHTSPSAKRRRTIGLYPYIAKQILAWISHHTWT